MKTDMQTKNNKILYSQKNKQRNTVKIVLREESAIKNLLNQINSGLNEKIFQKEAK